jgi:hypothetical protein
MDPLNNNSGAVIDLPGEGTGLDRPTTAELAIQAQTAVEEAESLFYPQGKAGQNIANAFSRCSESPEFIGIRYGPVKFERGLVVEMPYAVFQGTVGKFLGTNGEQVPGLKLGSHYTIKVPIFNGEAVAEAIVPPQDTLPLEPYSAEPFVYGTHADDLGTIYSVSQNGQTKYVHIPVWEDGAEIFIADSGETISLTHKGFRAGAEIIGESAILPDGEPIPLIYEIYDGPIEVINTEAANFQKGAGIFKYTAQNGEMRYVYLPPASETAAMTEIPVIALQKNGTVVPLRGLAISAVSGMAATAAGLLIINGAEYAFDKELGGWEKAGIMGGVGALTMVPAAAHYGVVATAAAGGGQFLVGLPISVGIGLEEQACGIDPSSTEGILLNAGGTIGLTYLASTASLPAAITSATGVTTLAGGTAAVTAGEATAGGLAAAGLGAAGVVTAIVGAGVVTYAGLEYGVGRIINDDGDGTLSGWMAEDKWNMAAAAATIVMGPVAGLAVYGLGRLVKHVQSGKSAES